MSEQGLLFPESEMAAPVARSFVVKVEPLELFEHATMLYLGEFVDASLYRCGFSGTERQRAVFQCDTERAILDRFIDDGEFAEKIGNADDPRPLLDEFIFERLAVARLTSLRQFRASTRSIHGRG